MKHKGDPVNMLQFFFDIFGFHNTQWSDGGHGVSPGQAQDPWGGDSPREYENTPGNNQDEWELVGMPELLGRHNNFPGDTGGDDGVVGGSDPGAIGDVGWSIGGSGGFTGIVVDFVDTYDPNHG